MVEGKTTSVESGTELWVCNVTTNKVKRGRR